MGMIEYLLLRDRVDDLANRMAGVHELSQGRLEHSLEAVHAEVESLRSDVEDLALYSRAVAAVLMKKGLFTHEELLQSMDEVDGSDGCVDGRITQAE